jgi:hypothetical protein
MIDAFHYSGFSSLFRIELIHLRISGRIVAPPTLITSAAVGTVTFDLVF